MKALDKIYLNRRHPEPYWFKDKQVDSDIEYIRKDALVPDNLDKAAEEWCKRNNKGIALCGDKKSHYLTEGVDAFKAGVEWMASQGVSVNAISSTEEDGITEEGMKSIADYLESLPDKTEVVLQIRKKQ